MPSQPWLGTEPFAVTLTVAWVLGVFAISPAPLQDLWRPLIVAVAVASAWTAAVSLTSRGNRWASLAAGSIWLLALTAWFVVMVIVALVVVRMGMAWLRRRRGRAPLREPAPRWVGRMANTLGVFLSIAAVIGAVNGGIMSTGVPSPEIGLIPNGAPNMYLIVVDGYPRADTTRADLGFSNEQFLVELERRGFDVARGARSNYNTTVLTLASALHMDYVENIPSLAGDPGNPITQVRRVTSAINRSPVVDSLRAAGFRVATIPSWYGEATLHSADVVRDSASITLFEEQVLRLGTLGRFVLTVEPDLVADQQRERLTFAFTTIPAVAEEEGDGVFLFVHLFSPHPPFLFEADGSPHPPPRCYPNRCSFNITDASDLGLTLDAYASAFREQLHYLNSELLVTIDRITGADPEGVVLLLSDHGVRHEAVPNDEHFRILFAARTPGREGLFPDDAAPVNLFRTLFNTYFGTELPILEYRAWSADPGSPLVLRPLQ